ncbi:MAG: carboxypeptidase regulatory-like domain-containing protein [Planctomycetes bacterium]|nr:carboxypeptidase regulatory-like domain-containing protein [Planctomycetota bacterium]
MVAGSLLLAAAIGGALLLGNKRARTPSTGSPAARGEPSRVKSEEAPAEPDTPAAGAPLAPGIPAGGGVRREIEAPVLGADIPASARTGIAGVVREAESGAPIRRFSVEGRRAGKGRMGLERGDVVLPARTLDAADGSFEILDVPPGSLYLEFEAEGFVPGEIESLEVAEGNVLRGVEVRLRLGVTVRGSVVERGTSNPVEGASVQIVEEGGPTSRTIRMLSSLSEQVPVTTGSDGRFQFVGRVPGTLRLGATHPSFAHALADPIEAKGGDVVEGVVIPLSRGGALDGHAIREGSPLPPTATVLVLPVGDLHERIPFEPRAVGIDETGYFKVERLTPGRYSVLASVPRRLVSCT